MTLRIYQSAYCYTTQKNEAYVKTMGCKKNNSTLYLMYQYCLNYNKYATLKKGINIKELEAMERGSVGLSTICSIFYKPKTALKNK